MNNNDIINALECCTGFSEGDCDICPLCNKEYCREALMGYSRNLINHLQAENKTLKNEIVIANKLLQDSHITITELGKLNEHIRLTAGTIPYEKEEIVEADANKLSIKEFIEKYYHNCGSQRCEGVNTEWFDGCEFKDRLGK